MLRAVLFVALIIAASARPIHVQLELVYPESCDPNVIDILTRNDIAPYYGVIEYVDCTRVVLIVESEYVGGIISSPEHAFPSLNPYLASVSVQQKMARPPRPSPPPIYTG